MPVVFEGPEKKVELVVVEGHPSLRSFGDAYWEGIAAACGATILNKASTEDVDAYLLSESSLFVWDGHFAMITCGRTHLAEAALLLLERVPPDAVAFLVLERKNEHFPHHQPSTFHEDARRLDAVLPGQALRFGDAHSHQIQVFHTARPFEPDDEDTTLEVLMHGIDPEVAAAFQGGGPDVVARAHTTGVAELLPDFTIDDYAFDPAGYSLNALNGEIYYTVHITPERIGSYVSFETNHDFRADPAALVRRVVDVFRPEAFDVFAWAPDAGRTSLTADDLDGYVLRKHTVADLCGYGVTFHHFFRPPRSPVAPDPISLG